LVSFASATWATRARQRCHPSPPRAPSLSNTPTVARPFPGELLFPRNRQNRGRAAVSMSSSTGPLWSVGSTIHGRMRPVHAYPRGSRAPPKPFDLHGLPPAGTRNRAGPSQIWPDPNFFRPISFFLFSSLFNQPVKIAIGFEIFKILRVCKLRDPKFCMLLNKFSII
jgi:hypothetical protein